MCSCFAFDRWLKTVLSDRFKTFAEHESSRRHCSVERWVLGRAQRCAMLGPFLSSVEVLVVV